MSSSISGILTTGLTATAPSGSKNDPQKIKEAASQFEALLIGQIMKSMHEEEGGGWLGTGEDQTASSAMGLADEYFAQAIAKQGGFGLARTITAGLEHASGAAAPNRSNPANSPLPPADPLSTPNTDR